MNVTAKFKCTSKIPVQNGGEEHGSIEFYAAYGEGNQAWSKATPSGNIRMFITNKAALDAFEVGRDYMLEFTEAQP